MTSNQISQEINSIKEQLVNKYHAEKIILFGSAAQGTLTPDSDLDFLVVKEDKRDYHDRIVNIYNLIDKNIAADFIVYTARELEDKVKMGDPFIKTILTEGKVIYG